MILFVDDEPREMDSYVKELQLLDYEVEFKRNVDDALRFFAGNYANIVLVILDIMMPPNNAFKDKDTEYGLRTGVHLYQEFRAQAPNLPIIVLTNVSDVRVAGYFRQELNVVFLPKEDVLPYELAEKVQSILTPRKQE